MERMKLLVRGRGWTVESKNPFPSQSRDRAARLRSVVKLLRISSPVLVLISIYLYFTEDFAAALAIFPVLGMALACGFMGKRLEKTARRTTPSQAIHASRRPAGAPVLLDRRVPEPPMLTDLLTGHAERHRDERAQAGTKLTHPSSSEAW
jgi:hypothetical protein